VDLPGAAGSGTESDCLIGIFGIPCSAEGNCVQGLHCEVPLPAFPNLKLCTEPCTSHADCRRSPYVSSNAYCAGAVIPGAAHVCAPAQDPGRSCLDNAQCRSGQCQCLGTCSPTNLGYCL
jgi:hypothetical protein